MREQRGPWHTGQGPFTVKEFDMPQREFWAQQIPREVRIAFWQQPTSPDDASTCSFNVLDQAGASMSFTGAILPPGFAIYAFTDAVRAGMEAYDAATPRDATRAFARAVSDWKRASGPAGLHGR